jgi:hypothetical protein
VHPAQASSSQGPNLFVFIVQRSRERRDDPWLILAAEAQGLGCRFSQRSVSMIHQGAGKVGQQTRGVGS